MIISIGLLVFGFSIIMVVWIRYTAQSDLKRMYGGRYYRKIKPLNFYCHLLMAILLFMLIVYGSYTDMIFINQ